MKRHSRAWRERNARRFGYAAVAGLLGISIFIPGSSPTAESDDVQSVRSQFAEAFSPDLPFFLGGETASDETVASESAAGWDLPNLDHPRVDYWVDRFQTDKREEFEGFLARKGRYEEMILSKLDERGMPRDILYLAMIESGFKPKAYSSAHASGIWQFIPETGKRYGLEINRAVDERNNPEKATDAALSYLSDLHKRFDSWYLAAASYNTGENRVGRIMRETTGSERGREQDYYLIWDRLPRETRDYVPLMIAAARISKDPVRYGFDHVVPEAPEQFKVLTVEAATPLSTIAKRAGTSVADLKRLNPELKIDRTRNDKATAIRVAG
jgi:membrane-bound lytic murein transglycosylase D